MFFIWFTELFYMHALFENKCPVANFKQFLKQVITSTYIERFRNTYIEKYIHLICFLYEIMSNDFHNFSIIFIHCEAEIEYVAQFR